MDIREAIYKRRSVRKFQEKQVDDQIIKSLLEDAMAAPSACNKQPWEFYVIKNKEKQDLIKSKIMFSNFNSPIMIVVCGNNEVSLTKDNNDFWIQDCSAAIENILLSAVSFGLGTCWCGLYPVEKRCERVREILDLPTNIIPLGTIHIGYPEKETEGRTQYKEEKVHYID